MKRRIIKRNKQLMTSRLKKMGGHLLSWQRIHYHLYFRGGKLCSRSRWEWYLTQKEVDKVTQYFSI